MVVSWLVISLGRGGELLAEGAVVDDFAVAQGAHNEVFMLVVGGRDADDMDIIVVKRSAPCGTSCSDHANLVESGERLDRLAGAERG